MELVLVEQRKSRSKRIGLILGLAVLAWYLISMWFIWHQ